MRSSLGEKDLEDDWEVMESKALLVQKEREKVLEEESRSLEDEIRRRMDKTAENEDDGSLQGTTEDDSEELVVENSREEEISRETAQTGEPKRWDSEIQLIDPNFELFVVFGTLSVLLFHSVAISPLTRLCC